MSAFDRCYNKVLILEGGYNLHYVNGDRGGMTYAGISRNNWPKWEGWWKIDTGEFDADLKRLVVSFYRENFWDMVQGDDIKSEEVACIIYDFAVNAGVITSVRIAQAICGTTTDGIFGPQTLEKINEMVVDEKDEKIFVLLFSLLKIFRYKDICANDYRRTGDKIESNLKFLIGWINRVKMNLDRYTVVKG